MKHFPTEVLRHHTAVLGKTGAGKTSTEKLIVEQVVADGARVCVLDTIKSDWWGITSSASGKRKARTSPLGTWKLLSMRELWATAAGAANEGLPPGPVEARQVRPASSLRRALPWS